MHRTLRTTALAVLGTACLLGTSSCAKHNYSDQYYLVATNIKLPYWQTANNGLMKAANLYGVKAEMRGTDTFDPKGEVQEFETVRRLGLPIKFSATPGEVRRPDGRCRRGFPPIRHPWAKGKLTVPP